MQIQLPRLSDLAPALLFGAAVWPAMAPAAPAPAAIHPVAAPAASPPNAGPARYRLRTETSMPNLDENLRYATRNEERCLDPADLSTQFWMTDDSALTDCHLEKARQDATAADYELICRGKHGAEGHARWTFDGPRISGVLDLRLGGKNMTLTQRITGERIGDCR